MKVPGIFLLMETANPFAFALSFLTFKWINPVNYEI
jgi:hypothetical protein